MAQELAPELVNQWESLLAQDLAEVMVCCLEYWMVQTMAPDWADSLGNQMVLHLEHLMVSVMDIHLEHLMVPVMDLYLEHLMAPNLALHLEM